jgi:hypothetical protein
MGRHVNADAGSDEAQAAEAEENGTSHEARHAAESGRPLEPQAVISADTHVGVDLSAPKKRTRSAAASPANPDALVEHGLVGDGHEME